MTKMNTYPVNYMRGKIARLFISQLEYDTINTHEMADWVKGCLVKANLSHLKEVTGSTLVKLVYQYGYSSPDKCIRLRNAHLISIGQGHIVKAEAEELLKK